MVAKTWIRPCRSECAVGQTSTESDIWMDEDTYTCQSETLVIELTQPDLAYKTGRALPVSIVSSCLFGINDPFLFTDRKLLGTPKVI